MSEHLKIERYGDSWAVMMVSDSTGDWVPVAEWDTEEEAWADLERWKSIQETKEAEKAKA